MTKKLCAPWLKVVEDVEGLETERVHFAVECNDPTDEV